MNLIDMLDMYAILNNKSEDLFLMLADYTLDSRIERDAMNKAIVTRLGACRPLTTNTTVFKVMLDEFFNRYNYNIGKLLDTMYYEYDPLENKDWTRTEHRESIGDIDNTDTYTTNTNGTDNLSRTDETQVSAYDSTSYQPKEKVVVGSNDTTTGSTTHSGATTSDITSDVDTEENFKGKDSDESYQSLIEQERELAQFNIYDWIIQQMRRELFLLIY